MHKLSLSECLPYDTTVFPGTDDTTRPHGWCGHQRSSEFERFVDLLIKHECKSLLFIGVGHGGNQLYIVRRYQELGMECRITMVDIQVHLGLAATMSVLHEECPHVSTKLIIANSQHLGVDDLGTHDAAFVDGDHGYPQTLHDVRLCDACVKHFTGCHDVTSIVKGGHTPIPSVHAWQVLKNGRRVDEFFTDQEMGIGVLYK